jgi:hypothetical protein
VNASKSAAFTLLILFSEAHIAESAPFLSRVLKRAALQVSMVGRFVAEFSGKVAQIPREL